MNKTILFRRGAMLRTWCMFPVLAGVALCAAPAQGRADAAENASAAEILRAAESRLRDGNVYVVIKRLGSRSAAPRFVKTYRHWTTDGELQQLVFSPRRTLEEAVADDGDLGITMLYRGDEMWIISKAKKTAYQLAHKTSPVADFSRQAELKAAMKCAVDYYADERIQHQTRGESIEGREFVAVSRVFDKSVRQQLQSCKISVSAILNSLIGVTVAKQPLFTFPQRVDYFIDGRGFLTMTRSYGNSGRLLAEDIAVRCEAFDRAPGPLFSIPKGYAIKIVAESKTERLMLHDL